MVLRFLNYPWHVRESAPVTTAQLVAPALTGDEVTVGILVCDGRGAVRAVTAHAASLLGLTDDDLASGARPSG